MLRRAVSAESLEPRRLLTAVSWVGASGDFNDPTHWDTGQVPATADDVTINVAAGITVNFTGGGVAVNSLATNASFLLSGGDLTVTGTLDLSNTFTLSGGNLHQAAVTGASNLAFTSSGGSLDNVSVDADLNLSDPSASVTIQPGGLALGGHTLHVSGDGAAVHFAGSQTFDHGKIRFEGTNELLAVDSGGVLTLGPATTVEGGGANIGQYSSTGTVDNQGLIVADAPGEELDVLANGFTSEGAIQATSGGTFAILGDGWTNTGTIDALTGGTVNLGGSIPTSALGTVHGTTGTVNLQAGLDNSGASFALDANTGSWNLDGGIISGGTLDFSGGASLNFINGATLDNVTPDNDLVLGDNNALDITNGLNLGTHSVYLTGNHAAITFDGTQTLASGMIKLGGTNDTLGIVGTSTLTLGSGVTVVGGDNAQIGVSAGEGPSTTTLVNQGTITASLSGTTTTIAPTTTFTNQGSVTASGGATIAIVPADSWSNTGSLAATTGGTLLLGGAMTTAGLGAVSGAGGTVDLIGTLDNSNADLTFDAATGTWDLDGGTIQGGSLTLNGAALNFTPAGGLLDGVTANNDLVLSDPGARVSIQNGLTLGTNAVHLQGDSAVLNFVGTQTLASGQVFFEGTGEAVSETPVGGEPMTLTLGPSVNVTGPGGLIGSPGTTLDNQGGIAIDTEGGTIQVAADTFDNEGLIEAVGATVAAAGDYNSTAASTVNIGFAGDGQIGQLQITGSAALAGKLRVLSGYNPPQGSTYTAVTYADKSGGFDTIELDTSPSVTLVPTQGPTSVTLYTQVGPTPTVNWIGPDGGDWGNPANWSTGQVPGSGDDVVITVSPGATVTHIGGDDTVHSLTSNALFDLSGGDLTVSTTLSLQATFTLSGGTLSGASVQNAFLLAFTPAGGALDGVTVDNDLSVPADNATVSVTGGLTLGGNTVHLFGNGDSIVFQDDETLASGAISFQGSNDGIGIGNGSTLTLGPGATVYANDGGNLGFGPGTTTLVNQGTILTGDTPASPAAVVRPAGQIRPLDMTSPQPVAILAGTFTNQGSVEVDNGTLSISPSTAWTNAGVFSAQPGATLDLGGSTTTARLGSIANAGGTIDLSGTVDNTNATFTLDATTGPWTLTGGTIQGGTLAVNGPDLNFTAVGGTLDGVTAGSDLIVGPSGAQLNLLHGLDLGGHTLQLAGDNVVVNCAGTQTLDDGTLTFLGNSDALTQGGRGGSTLTLGAGLVAQEAGGSDARLGSLGFVLLNRGAITAATSGQAIQVNASVFDNEGLLQANGQVISVNGDLKAGDNSEIQVNFETAGPGRVTVAGTANLGGTLTINAPNPPAPGGSFDVLTYSTSAGTFATINGLVTPSVTLTPTIGPNAVSLFALGGPTGPQTDLQSLLNITGPFYTPGTYQPGDVVPFRATEEDTGAVPTGAFEVDVVLSTDTVYGNDDDVSVLSKQEASLDPGQMRLMTNFVTIPADAPPGKYYVLGESFFPDPTSSSTDPTGTGGSTPAVSSASPGGAHKPSVSDPSVPTDPNAPDSGGMHRGYVSPTANIIVAAPPGSTGGGDGGSTAPPVKVGGLNTNFGNAGVAAHNVGFTSTNDVAIQSDGQSVIVGSYGSAGSQDFGVTRYSATGGIDPNFGNTDTPGISTVDFGGDDTPATVVLLPNGKILVAGTSVRTVNGQPAGSEFAVARFNADGSLDTTFGNGTGKVLLGFAKPGTTSNDLARSLVVAPDGTFYVAGSSDANGHGKDFAVAGFNSDGSPDAAFGKAGKLLLDFAGGDDAIAGVVLQSNGDLVLAGSSAMPGGATAVAVARLLPGGALDPKFGKKGLVTTNVRGVDDEAASVAVDSSGRIIVGGLSATGSASSGTLASDFLVIRYTKAGKVDRTFGRGPVITRFGQPSAVTRVLVERDGTVVASGRTTSGLSDLDVTQLDVALARYTAKGTLDKTFNGTGTAVVSLNGETDPSAVSAKHPHGPLVGDASGSSLKQKFSQFEQSSQGALAQNSGGELFDVGTSGTDTSEADIVASGVDLATSLTANLPAKVSGGSKAAASVQLTNAGSVPVSGPVTISLYVSPNPQAGAGQTLLQGFAQKVNLRANQSKTFSLKFTLPASLPSGSYYLLATTSSSSFADLNPSDNTDVTASTFAVSKPTVDLAAGTLSVPGSVTRGKSVSVSLAVSNAGNVAVKGTTSVQFFASVDGKLTGATSLATASGLRINLQPGAKATFSQKLVVPASLPAGSYRLLALIDPANTLGESDMTNNLLTSAGGLMAA